MADAEVRISSDTSLGYLELCNAGTLNALTLDAITSLREGLQQHENNPQVKAILIRSDSDRAFCAGGQMKLLRESAMNNRFDDIDTFFENEYALNLAIANCKKPYIALIDGIAMGGGLGISVHGSFRIVTERAVLAMPETRIGFFPDVGASFFLQSLNFRAAYWLGLTAVSITAEQSQAVGLATHMIHRDSVPSMINALHASLAPCAVEDVGTLHTTVNTTLDTFSTDHDRGQSLSTLEQRAHWFAEDKLELIRERLQNAITQTDDAHRADVVDAQQLLTLLDTGSPYSLSITLDLFKRTQGLSLANCLNIERQLAAKACRHPDFIEGIRSVLIDKDKQPRWDTSTNG